MENLLKRIAYLAPELPSLSATFVTNEIWSLEDLGAEVVPYSVHKPQYKAHGKKAETLAARTSVVYDKPWQENILALIQLAITHKRSFFRSVSYLVRDVSKTGLFKTQALKLVYQYLKSAWLAKDLRAQNVEHLHIHFAHVPTQIGMYAATLAGIPFTFMSHANDLFERPLLIPEKITRAHRAVTISEFNVALMTSLGGDANRMEIVRCGVKSSETIPVSEPGAEQTFVIGTLGRLVEKKGVDTLLKAGHLLQEQGLDFRIEIAGDGPLSTELKRLSQDLGLSDHVHFIGSLPHAAVLPWMRSLDVFVLAGKKDKNGDMDGIPVVLMEAMTMGIPVVSTRLSGIPELVIHEETGLLGHPEDALDLATNLKRLMDDEQLRPVLVRGGFAHVQKEFDNELNALRLLQIIHTPRFEMAA
jgi:colanic acid/amylovoran biosynthesis glycosyltransferase